MLKRCGYRQTYAVGGGYAAANTADAENAFFGLAKVEGDAGGLDDVGSRYVVIMGAVCFVVIAVVPLVGDGDEPVRSDGIF